MNSMGIRYQMVMEGHSSPTVAGLSSPRNPSNMLGHRK